MLSHLPALLRSRGGLYVLAWYYWISHFLDMSEIWGNRIIQVLISNEHAVICRIDPACPCRSYLYEIPCTGNVTNALRLTNLCLVH